MRVELSGGIAAPAGKVWSLITEPENIVQWHPRAQSVAFIGEQHGGVGILFYMESKADGDKLMRSVCEITEWQENERFAFHEILGSTKKFEALFIIEDHGENSRLTMVADCILPYWIIGRIILLLIRKKWIKMMEEMLSNLRQLAES